MEGEICHLEMIINSSKMFWDWKEKIKRKYSGVMLKKASEALTVTEYTGARQNSFPTGIMFVV